MTIEKPEQQGYAPARLSMFCRESRLPREIYWAGFGFQIWMQFLTHLILSSSSAILVVDEPDIYLHPELQHRLLTLLRERTAPVVLATHSTEIINDADPRDVILVDKSRTLGRRLSDLEGVQDVLNKMGSNQNILLTRLSRGKRILFIEGQD